MKKIFLIIGFSLYGLASMGQTFVSGIIKNADTKEIISGASILFPSLGIGSITNTAGYFSLPIDSLKLPIRMHVSSVGFKNEIVIIEKNSADVQIFLTPVKGSLNEVVITGTRTAKNKLNSAVMVKVINSNTLNYLVTNNLSEGLSFQTGLRVETNCQTCNYSQLKINGLSGGYSQILVNSRPVFSALMGLYGLDQIPANMIERIEVVKGGISALYGSSAIGGTINIITKIPANNSYQFTSSFLHIKNQSSDHIISGNASLLNNKKNAGAHVFFNTRNRDSYDANADNFSELPMLKERSFGANLFFNPSLNQKLTLSLGSLYEYRYGGENIKLPAHYALQSEERQHQIFMGNAEYSYGFNHQKSLLSFYIGTQHTKRKHYTGTMPDSVPEQINFMAHPPYGKSRATITQIGLQLNHKINHFVAGKTTLTIGLEQVTDAVLDEIKTYQYHLNQTTHNTALLFQNDWEVSKHFNLLTGFRIDKHNFVRRPIVSPRISFLYKPIPSTQIRVGWGKGFRAPQAFDADLHMAFAAGGISRISLAENLKEERSNSFTASLNFDKAKEQFIAGFTLETFYTNLKDAFFQFPLAPDAFGERYEKRNGSGATVKGITVETRANFKEQIQMELGFTWQSSKYKEAVENIKGLEKTKSFLRSPNHYGFASFTYTAFKKINFKADVVFTGPMLLAHFAGTGTGQLKNEYFTSSSFTDLGLRVDYTCKLSQIPAELIIFSGVKNALDQYQQKWDVGKNRDSNFIYGPNLPRTFFIGIKFKSI